MADTPSYYTRKVTADDEAFLCTLYASTRADEVAEWGWPQDQQRDFLKQQFSLQHRSYAMQFPGADHRIIMCDDRLIGRILVYRAENEWRLVDIALLPRDRDRGIGTGLIRSLIAEAIEQRCPFRLQVVTTNPAVGLYERLGFRGIGSDALYHQMEFIPS